MGVCMFTNALLRAHNDAKADPRSVASVTTCSWSIILHQLTQALNFVFIQNQFKIEHSHHCDTIVNVKFWNFQNQKKCHQKNAATQNMFLYVVTGDQKRSFRKRTRKKIYTFIQLHCIVKISRVSHWLFYFNLRDHADLSLVGRRCDFIKRCYRDDISARRLISVIYA